MRTGFFGDVEGVESGAVAAVGDVNGHAELVHALDDSEAEVGEAFVAALGAAVTDESAGVVSE